MKNASYLILFTFCNLYSQVNFNNGETLIDLTHYSSDISALFAADLNNDGYKEIIVGSYYDNKIMFYKNINGNIQYYQKQILIQNPSTSYYSDFDIYCADIDNDGLIDIAVTHSGIDKISWYRNLGNYNFDNEKIITTNIDKPKSLVVADIDNDGDNDFIVGSENDKNVSLFTNSGNGTFSTQQIIYNAAYGVNKVKLFDLDNNGFLDIISGQENGSIYWSKNIDGSTFSPSNYIPASADDGYGFDFLDINGDTYYDIVFSSNYNDNLKYILNMSGESFSSETIIDNSLSDPYNLIVKDFDNDGLKDIIISTTTNDKIGWYKNNNNGSFSSLILITSNVANPKHFLIEDIENNGSLEVISSSFQSDEVTNQKLSIFKKNLTANSYEETIINFYYSYPKTIRVADLDNDGNNDIISALLGITWNKNYGNNIFSSQYLITNSNDTWTNDIEIKDLDLDGWLDIIGVIGNKLEVYKNVNGEHFELVYSQIIEGGPEEVEISDINNDGNFDILVSHNSGSVIISKIINNGNFNFQDITPIHTRTNTGYSAYNFKCGDLDNDGDNDIVVGARDIHEIYRLKNDGSGSFTYELIMSPIACNKIDIGDIDNDGDIDIVTADSNSYSALDFFWLKNNVNSFDTPVKIDTQSLKSITLGDINNDGFLDILGSSYQGYAPFSERIFYYLFNGNSFADPVDVENTSSNSTNKDAILGDLNNDNKLDIISSYFFTHTIKYFINSSTLSLGDINITKAKELRVYPNPSSKSIHWNKKLEISNISIFNSNGKVVYNNNETITLNKLNISFLSKGFYFIIANSKQSKYTAKLIIN